MVMSTLVVQPDRLHDRKYLNLVDWPRAGLNWANFGLSTVLNSLGSTTRDIDFVSVRN